MNSEQHVGYVLDYISEDGCRWIKLRTGNKDIFSGIGSSKCAFDICFLFLYILFTF